MTRHQRRGTAAPSGLRSLHGPVLLAPNSAEGSRASQGCSTSCRKPCPSAETATSAATRAGLP